MILKLLHKMKHETNFVGLLGKIYMYNTIQTLQEAVFTYKEIEVEKATFQHEDQAKACCEVGQFKFWIVLWLVGSI